MLLYNLQFFVVSVKAEVSDILYDTPNEICTFFIFMNNVFETLKFDVMRGI